MIYLLPSAACSQVKRVTLHLYALFLCNITYPYADVYHAKQSFFFPSSKWSHFYLFIDSLELIQSSP